MTEWQSARLGDLCKIDIGKTPSRGVSRYWDKGRETDNVWLSIADLTQSQGGQIYDSKEYVSDEAARSLKPVKAGTLLMSFKLSIGKMAVAGRDLFTNEAIAALTIIDSKSMSREYLQYFLSGYDWEAATAGDHKVKGKTLNKAKLKELNISFPPPTEQQRIVGILDQAFEGIAKAKANAEQNLGNAKELLANAFDDLLALRCQDAPIAPLDTIAEFKNGLNFTRSSKGEVIKIVCVADFKNNFWTPEQLDEVQIEGSLSEAYELRDNDILVVRSNGNKELIGRCILARGVKGKTSHSGFTIRVRLHSDEVDAEYLTHFMKSSAVRKSLVASGDGANISSLNQKALSSIIVPLPPVSVQRDIVNDLSTLGEKIGQMTAIISQKSSAIDELRQSILHQAFSGNL